MNNETVLKRGTAKTTEHRIKLIKEFEKKIRLLDKDQLKYLISLALQLKNKDESGERA